MTKRTTSPIPSRKSKQLRYQQRQYRTTDPAAIVLPTHSFHDNYSMTPPPVLLPACANWIPGNSPCNRQGTKACGNCKLVMYCGADCQKAHWPEHKKVCRSPLGKDNWRPSWDCEGRVPPWANGQAAKNIHNTFGGNKFLWGNTPAVDVLKLKQNEGLEYEDDIALLFAASGDLRHVVKTIADLPEDLTQQISITMNDRDFGVVARNTIMLLLVLTAEDTPDIQGTIIPFNFAEALLHVWYSALIPSGVLSYLKTRVIPMITEVCNRIANKPPNTILAKTWEFSGGQTFRLVLKTEEWLKLRNFLDMPHNLTPENATQIRRATTLAPERKDYRDRWYFKEATPFMRVAKQRFQEDGLLLPFGHPRLAFDTPNPTLFQSSKCWPMDDKDDPSNGWPVMDIQRTSSLASGDWYGKLFIYLHAVFQRFLSRLAKSQINFEFYNVDVTELPRHLQLDKYSRIEVANICDVGYLGIRQTLSLLAPLLQSPQRNPHAILLTLFINALVETVKRSHAKDQAPDMEFLANYLPLSSSAFQSSSLTNDAEMLRIWDARNLALDANKFFQKYMQFWGFEKVAFDLNLEMKKGNTVVEEWQTRLKLRLGQTGAEEEFRLLLGAGFANTERYVEWKRTFDQIEPRDVQDRKKDTGVTKCANCGVVASMRCARCVDAPVYEPGEPVTVFYCSDDCQKSNWQTHKPRCNVMEKRKKLFRIATILKGTLLAYRECVFDVDIERIEFRDGILGLHLGSELGHPCHTQFPNHLTANLEHREAALANNECTLAMALLGPLARQLLSGVRSSVMMSDISIGKPIFTTKLISNLSNLPNYSPPHTILVLHLRDKNNDDDDEKWIIDVAGCQYGFREVLIPFERYFEEHACQDLNRSQPYDANETKDIDFFLTIPAMTTSALQRKKLKEERAARLHFAAFVKALIDEGGGVDFNRYMLSGSTSEFQAKLNRFVGDLKVHMTGFVERK